MLYTFIIQNPTNPAVYGTAKSVITSAGITDGNKVVLTDPSTGQIDASLIPGGGGGVSNLQQAYNGGAGIVLTNAHGPLTLTGWDTSSTSLYIKDSTNADVFKVNSDKSAVLGGEMKAQAYTGSLSAVVATNTANSQVDAYATGLYRAIQYAYTANASDNTGYETGQVYIIHDGTNANYIHNIGITIGIPLGLTFSSDVSGGNIRLLATTDNSGSFSRIIKLFKVVLP